ncbi:MAG: hypothetical protein AMXMBFR84_15160 [Candidatus Hydrogenedentota bacterium]
MPEDESDSQSLYLKLTIVIQTTMAIGLVVFVVRQDWENVFLTLLVIALTVVPAVLKRYRIYLPPEFQLISAAFIFLSFFLGSAGDFYYKFWWWDLALHAGSGFLFGMVGFITLYLLNQTSRLPKGIHPTFVCFFGVTFAVFMGVIWEIFEYIVDRALPGTNMQSVETGIDDTMQDLMVDIAGAAVVAAMGMAYFKSGRYSFIGDGIRAFIRRNPRLFRKRS